LHFETRYEIKIFVDLNKAIRLKNSSAKIFPLTEELIIYIL